MTPPDHDDALAALRRDEYGRLDATGSVYLDYAGASLPAVSQVREHARLLACGVFGNPHSRNPASLASTAIVDDARRRVLSFFGADPDEYACVFTANASAAIKLMAEAYPFGADAGLTLTADNHNSVNGIREFARRRGAVVRYLPIGAEAFGPGDGPGLFAFPAQSNFSGVQHPLALVDDAHARGWDVLLDASAFVPTNRLDLSAVRPDFLAMSFYKMFGWPTGVGCLLARRAALARLERPWFAGGAVTVASVAGDGHWLAPGEAGFEDGTVDFLNLAAVPIGLDHLDRVGVGAIHRRVACLTAWLLEELAALRHRNGRRLVRVLGPQDARDRGATIAFVLEGADGRRIDSATVELLANRERISLRSGCFCNPGAAEAAFGLTAEHVRPWLTGDRAVTHDELRDAGGQPLGALRASLGIASTFADASALVRFLSGFVQ